MNRLDQLSKNTRTISSRLLERQCRRTMSLSQPHRVFMPEHYEPRYEYPLVIWLHSDRSSEYEIDEVMPALSTRNYVAVSIRGNQRSSRSKRCFGWSQSAAGQALIEECVFDAIDVACEGLSIHSRKIFIAGYGQGGTLAQWLGLRHPDRFAGVVSCNGEFPSFPKTLARWKEAKGLPILWMHGQQSKACGIDSLCDMLRLAYLSALEIYPVQFACGDDLDQGMLTKANRFMMQIVTGESIVLHEVNA